MEYTRGEKQVILTGEIEGLPFKAKLDTVKPEDLGVDVAPRIKTLKVAEPAKRGAGVKVPDVATLVEKLKNEAKVI